MSSLALDTKDFLLFKANYATFKLDKERKNKELTK